MGGVNAILTVDRSSRRRRRRSRRGKIASRPWSDLPEDILRLIVRRLHLVDRIHFHGVCKNWLSTPIHDIQIIDKLPWIMNYRFSPARTICSLFEPYGGLLYTMEDERGWTPAGSKLSRATACASRCGWVLFFESCKDQFDYVISYYVYNPLTKEIISLPSLKWPHLEYEYDFNDRASFSSAPTSPDCVFIVPRLCGRDRMFISTYSIGNETWKTHAFTSPQPYFYSDCGLAFMEGTFYGISVLGGLSSFNIATQEWRLLPSECDWGGCNPSQGSCYFVAYGGHLYLVHFGEFDICRDHGCNIFRYDWSDGVWKKIESLEGGAMFLGKLSFGISAGEQTKMVANRVYFFSSQTYTPGFLIYGPVEERPAGMGESPKSQDAINYATRIERIWMEPPLLMP